MRPWGTDISSGYLEAKTQEKVCFKVGPKFGEYADHLLIIYKAVCGLQSSGLRFQELLISELGKLGFKPSHY